MTQGAAGQPAIAIVRAVAVWVLAVLGLLLTGSARAQQAQYDRGTAQIIVSADLTNSKSVDRVMIRLVGQRDKDQLFTLANNLGARVRQNPTFFELTEPKGEWIHDNGYCLEFNMDLVPRTGDGFFPIGPFIETFAAHAKQVQILYFINGRFTYKGNTEYTGKDFAFTVDSGVNEELSTAIYGVDVTIHNPNLTSADMPRTAAEARTRRNRIPAIIMITLAVIIGILGGVLLTMLIAKWKAEDAARTTQLVRGGKHERSDHDA